MSYSLLFSSSPVLLIYSNILLQPVCYQCQTMTVSLRITLTLTLSQVTFSLVALLTLLTANLLIVFLLPLESLAPLLVSLHPHHLLDRVFHQGEHQHLPALSAVAASLGLRLVPGSGYGRLGRVGSTVSGQA